jgi:hypothetical protein
MPVWISAVDAWTSVFDEHGERLEVGVALPDAGGLAQLVKHIRDRYGPQPVRAAVESMNGARFVHDRLERLAGRSRSPTPSR